MGKLVKCRLVVRNKSIWNESNWGNFLRIRDFDNLSKHLKKTSLAAEQSKIKDQYECLVKHILKKFTVKETGPLKELLGLDTEMLAESSEQAKKHFDLRKSLCSSKKV